MRFKEFSEGVPGSVEAATGLTTIAAELGLEPETPWLKKLVAYAPGTISLLGNIIAGNGTTAAMDALEVSLGNANLLPDEAKAAVNKFAALRSAKGLSVNRLVRRAPANLAPVALGAAPLAAMAGATQQAATADMNSDQANMFGSTAKLGKKIGDWANKVSGRDDKYAQMRAAQRTDLQPK